jgi:hypothetical protein
MLVFIDDSGDPGFKVERGSSPVFVISCVIFDDELEAEKAAVAIKELRRSLRRSDRYEFKFNKGDRKTRIAFLESVRKFEFRVRAIIFNKSELRSEELRSSKQSFYNYAIKMVLKNNSGTILDAKLRLDGHGDRVYKREVIKYLRRELNSAERKVFNKLQFVDSGSNVLIQLADMVAGSIYRKYTSKKADASEYIRVIKKRIENLWEFK